MRACVRACVSDLANMAAGRANVKGLSYVTHSVVFVFVVVLEIDIPGFVVVLKSLVVEFVFVF